MHLRLFTFKAISENYLTVIKKKRSPNLAFLCRLLVAFLSLIAINGYLPVKSWAVASIRVGIFQNKPLVYFEDGDPKGLFVEILDHLAPKEGWKIEYVPCELNQCLDLLKSNQIDLMTALGASHERAAYLDYSREPVWTLWGTIYSHDFGIHGIFDLRGKSIGVIKGSRITAALGKMLNDFKVSVRYVEFDNYGSLFSAFTKKKIDVFTVNNTHGFDMQKGMVLHKTPIVFAPFDIFFAAPRNGRYTGKLAVIDAYVKALKTDKNSLFHAFENKWFGVPQTYWTAKRIGIISGIILSLTIVAMAFWRYRSLITINQELTVNIAEREKAESALQKSEKKFRFILENLMDVYFETTIDGTIEYTNPSGAKFSGYSISELIGNKVDMLYHNPQDREGLLKELRKRGHVREYEMVFRKKHGELYDVSINADLSFDPNGQPAGMTGTIRDITQQKRLKEQLHRSKKMESLGLMAGGIAHDLNNILSGIASYPELLLMQIPEDSPLREPLKTIQDSGRRAADVVADLITVAKGAATDKEIVNLNTVISEHFNSGEHKKLLRDHPGIVIKQELEPELLNIRCSSPHIKKVLMNLMANAADAITNDGVITIRTSNEYIDKPLDGYDNIKTGEYVLLSVADTGSGISKDDIPMIFEPFYTKKVMGRQGTGLGLTVIWNTVKDHGGYINVSSSENGTSFCLYFPVTREVPAAVAETKRGSDLLGNGEKILVVDDEKNQREIACALLTQLGYKAESAADGEEAVQYLEKAAVDLLVLDMIMPGGMSGRETYDRVVKIHPKQKAIIASGYAETEDVKEMQKAGAGEFIRKPYTMEKIGMAIRNELQKGTEG